MREIQVECYSGYRAEERPVRVRLNEVALEVCSIDGRWFSPDADWFRVNASDGNVYVLRHEHGQDRWELAGFRAGGNLPLQ